MIHLLKALAALSLAFLMTAECAHAARDTCVKDGGTADCRGPEVGPFTYYVGDAGASEAAATEEAAVEAYRQRILTALNACTVTVDPGNLPPYPPVPPGHGHSQMGTVRSLTIPFWALDRTLSAETYTQRSSMVRNTTHPVNSTPACRYTSRVAVDVTR